MKIAIAGKGGTGKTTIAGTMARLLAMKGYNVLAVDADPSLSLAYAIGIPMDVAEKIVPVSENARLIEERTGVSPGTLGAIFRLNPKVDDIIDKFGVIGPDGVKLLVMGTVRAGGTGCMCPANALLRALLRHIALERKDLVVLDMEAGIEHLGRGTARGVDVMLVIVEPGSQSIETAKRIRDLAGDIGVGRVLVVGNKVSTHKDRDFISDKLSEANLPLIGFIPFDLSIARADMNRIAPIDYAPESSAVQSIRDLVASPELRELSFR